MSLKGLIFDLDGVIVFTDQYHYKAWKQMADEKGIYFDQEINNRLRGVSRMDSLEINLERYEGHPLSDEEKQKMAEEKNDIYKKLLEQMPFSFSFVDTGSPCRPQVQAASHKAGQTLEVNSGKQWVFDSLI